MIDVLVQNGGTPIDDENDVECTHLVCIGLLDYVLCFNVVLNSCYKNTTKLWSVTNYLN